MPILIVVNKSEKWPERIQGIQLVGARAYLTEKTYSEMRDATVFNLCRSYGYQSLGYYVSLLAEARGHRPQPNVATSQDMKLQAVVRILSDDFDDSVQRGLAQIQGREFTLSIYFGQSIAQRYRRLALQLFNHFQAPLLRARFTRDEDGWQLQTVTPIPANEIPESHMAFVIEAAGTYFASKRFSPRRQKQKCWDIAILHDPDEDHPPSNAGAIRRFVRAAESVSLGVELIGKDDYGRLAEFDALFIRQTTAVNHFTYRFARRAAASGLVVVDDPQSIVRCANKVYLAELLDHHGIPTPRTLIVHKDNVDQVVPTLGLPCVLKQPDSAFSRGVVKVEDEQQLQQELARLLADSDLVIAQQFVPTDYDWRVGVFDRQPIFVCRYYMAERHWQIIKRDPGGTRFGKVDTMPVDVAPKRIVGLAVRAANLIGDGLYGVDLKQSGKDVHVIEINDNPNIDAGFEDSVLKQDLYTHIMRGFVARIEKRKALTGRLP